MKELLKETDCKDNSITNEQDLDCPFDFTSRCTLGRCNCKPKNNKKK